MLFIVALVVCCLLGIAAGIGLAAALGYQLADSDKYRLLKRAEYRLSQQNVARLESEVLTTQKQKEAQLKALRGEVRAELQSTICCLDEKDHHQRVKDSLAETCVVCGGALTEYQDEDQDWRLFEPERFRDPVKPSINGMICGACAAGNTAHSGEVAERFKTNLHKVRRTLTR